MFLAFCTLVCYNTDAVKSKRSSRRIWRRGGYFFFVQIVSIPNCEADSRLKIGLTFLHSWRKIQIEELPVQHWRSLTCKLQKEVIACFGRLGGYFFLLLQMILMTCKNKPQIPTIRRRSCKISAVLIGMALLSQRAINKTKAPSGASHMERRTSEGQPPTALALFVL